MVEERLGSHRICITVVVCPRFEFEISSRCCAVHLQVFAASLHMADSHSKDLHR